MTHTPDEHVTQFAKGKIKKCGDVEPGGKSAVVENCIFESLRKDEPFYAWYWLRPVDSVPASGLIMNAIMSYLSHGMTAGTCGGEVCSVRSNVVHGQFL